jgi:hypothetical protein
MPRRGPFFSIGLIIGIAAVLLYKTLPPLPMAMPAPEQAFIAAVARAQTDWSTAPNDVARVGMRQARAASLCRVLPGLIFSDWVGRVARIEPSSLPDLRGRATARISIALAPGLTLSTPAYGLLNLPSTMVEAGSAIYAVAASLPIGQKVVFSGRFEASGTDCMAEDSFTDDGSMRNPEFKVVLSGLAAKEGSWIASLRSQ